LYPTKVGVVLIFMMLSTRGFSTSGAAKALFREGGDFQYFNLLEQTPDQSSTSELAIINNRKSFLATQTFYI